LSSIPGAPPRPLNDVIAVSAGSLVYVGMLFRGHIGLIGMSPLG
jgi:hypothetical protein